MQLSGGRIGVDQEIGGVSRQGVCRRGWVSDHWVWASDDTAGVVSRNAIDEAQAAALLAREMLARPRAVSRAVW